ncbi:uncharacterized protein LOC131928858 [Physella acuta]|uniref:uncharacterized protein LOC131928858 n=1 Tax=Physella acuta TaxID=109671 RepID=UPI0027DC48A2|nr:uncharacterized protein LOC131928858 [Physella acuta]XP_059140987.1 uncharacterized protein LOC131928858 [Physella acuta]XP_059140988.1 uncharacterized protein LOC131928858 [Physella acuta]XP_059140989.1 uncharacterized protein LOC131928858 [Physella acuta]
MRVWTHICCLVVLFVGIIRTCFTNKNYNATNPIYCKGGRRVCVRGAECVRDKCVCKTGKGNGYFQCHNDDTDVCYESGDPHLVTFSGSNADIDMPCRHHLASFWKKDLVSKNTCKFKVFGVNQVCSQGVYYASQATVDLTVIDLKGYSHRLQVVMSDGFGVYQLGNSRPHVFDGECDNIELNMGDITVFINFDVEDKFFQVRIPACQTIVKFRAPDFDARQIRNQLRTPGIFISSVNPIFPLLTSSNQAQLCLTPAQNTTYYEDEAKAKDFENERLEVLRRYLEDSEHGQEQDGKYASDCQKVQKNYANYCPKARKLIALRACGPILGSRTLTDCLILSKQNFMAAFERCIFAFCRRDVPACKAAQSILDVCGYKSLDCRSLA